MSGASNKNASVHSSSSVLPFTQPSPTPPNSVSVASPLPSTSTITGSALPSGVSSGDQAPALKGRRQKSGGVHYSNKDKDRSQPIAPSPALSPSLSPARAHSLSASTSSSVIRPSRFSGAAASDWAGLPVELLLAVLRECALRELLSVAQVCTAWELVARDGSLWRRLVHAHFGHNANLTEGAFAKLQHQWPHVLRDWKDWYLFRRMFKREVAGSVHVDMLAYECEGKTKLVQDKRSSFSPYAQLQREQWGAEWHCGAQQPVQKGVRDITFHFAAPNTVLHILVHRRSARFAKKQLVGRTELPIFALRSEVSTLWLELKDVAPELTDGDAGSVRIAVRVTLKPVRYTVNDFEFVATVSHGSSALGASEMLFVRDRDTKKPYFMKILSVGGGPEWQQRDAESSSEGEAGRARAGEAEEQDAFTYEMPVVRDAEGEASARAASEGDELVLQSRLPSHPFVVDLFTSFRKGMTHYYLMEWVEGGELFSTVKRAAEGRFAEDQARFYCAEAVLALEHLHAHGVIYRDLRPENLLLDRKGHVKLTRALRAADAAERYSEYLAPEVLSGVLHEGKLTFAQACKVDWWSLGTILYQMLVGVAPFSHPSVTVTTQRILQAHYTLPQGKYALSASAQDLVCGLLTRSLKKRFDVRQIKRHPFFASLNWNALARRELKPSVRPFRRWPQVERSSSALTESCSTSESTTSTTLSEMLTSSRA